MAAEGKNQITKVQQSDKNDKYRQLRISYASDFTSQLMYAGGIRGVMLRGEAAHIDLYQAVMPGNEKQNQPEQRIVSYR